MRTAFFSLRYDQWGKLFIRLTLLSLSVLKCFECLPAEAARQTFLLKGVSVSLDIPPGWIAAPDHLGVPLMLLGPINNGDRPIISIVPTGLNEEVLDINEMGADQGSYQQEREKWLVQRGGTSLEYFPFTTENWLTGVRAHWIGFRYRLARNEYTSKSFTLVCKEKVFQIGTLIRSDKVASLSIQQNSLLKSFGCATQM